MAEVSTDIREIVRDRYAKAAEASAADGDQEAAALESEAGCCGPDGCSAGDSGVWGPGLYGEADRQNVPAVAQDAIKPWQTRSYGGEY